MTVSGAGKEQEAEVSGTGEEQAESLLRAEGLLPGDAYMEGSCVVFTAQFHLRRGYCCNSGCRHCPYR